MTLDYTTELVSNWTPLSPEQARVNIVSVFGDAEDYNVSDIFTLIRAFNHNQMGRKPIL